MSEAYPLCTLRLRRAAAAPPAPEALHRQRQYGQQYDYELEVGQSFRDGLHHDEDETPGSTMLRVSDILSLEWGTTQSLAGVGNDHRPALILVARRSPEAAAGLSWAAGGPPCDGGEATPEQASGGGAARRGGRRTPASPSPGGAATPASAVGGAAILRRYAVQMAQAAYVRRRPANTVSHRDC